MSKKPTRSTRASWYRDQSPEAREKALAKQRKEYAADPQKFLGKTRRVKQSNYEKYAGYQRRYQLMARYGITEDEFDIQFIGQDERCAICKTCKPGTVWHLDHCHKTGMMRGVLCARCNTTIGRFEDDVTLLRSAVAYLEKYHPELDTE